MRRSWVEVLVNPLGEGGGAKVKGGEVKSQSQAGHNPRGVIAAGDVGQLMSENGASF